MTRPVTTSGRFVRLGTASLQSEPGGPFVNLERINMQKVSCFPMHARASAWTDCEPCVHQVRGKASHGQGALRLHLPRRAQPQKSRRALRRCHSSVQVQRLVLESAAGQGSISSADACLLPLSRGCASDDPYSCIPRGTFSLACCEKPNSSFFRR